LHFKHTFAKQNDSLKVELVQRLGHMTFAVTALFKCQTTTKLVTNSDGSSPVMQNIISRQQYNCSQLQLSCCCISSKLVTVIVAFTDNVCKYVSVCQPCILTHIQALPVEGRWHLRSLSIKTTWA